MSSLFNTTFKKITGGITLACLVAAIIIRMGGDPGTAGGFLVLAAIFGVLFGLLNVSGFFK